MREALAESKRAAKKSKQRRGGAKHQRSAHKLLTPDEEAALRLELERTENRLAADRKRSREREVEAAIRKEERAAVEAGKNPFFAKRSVIRERKLLARYTELQSKGGDGKPRKKKTRSFSSRERLPPHKRAKHGGEQSAL